MAGSAGEREIKVSCNNSHRVANVCLNIELGEGDLCHRQSPHLAGSAGAREIKVSKYQRNSCHW